MSLSNIINGISKGWKEYKDHCKSTNPKGTEIRVVKPDHKIYDLIMSDWEKEVSNIVNSEKYSVKSSVGEGMLVSGPWLAIMDKSITKSARDGYYIVYLFSRSARKLYLSMGLGAVQFERIHGKNNSCLSAIDNSRNKFKVLFDHLKPKDTSSEIDILEDDYEEEKPLGGSSRFLSNCYQNGTCFAKEYQLDQINDVELRNDIKEFINSYQEIVLDPQSDNLDFLAESTKQEEKPKNFDYQPKEFSPREKKTKSAKKISIVKKAKKKRQTQESKKIGRAGEDYVYKFEYNKLIKANKKDLANKIDKHYEKYEYPGWDITSFDTNGEKIFIEVKSTKGEVINDLDITDNEWEAAQKERTNYYVYLVNKVLTENIQIFEIIKNPADCVEKKQISLSVSVWNLKLN